MHALVMLHRLLAASCPGIHAKRLESLLAAVEAAVCGSRLALSDLGRGLRGRVAVKHNIKRVDRLLGNAALHTEASRLYASLARQCLAGVRTPLIIIRLVGSDARSALAVVARLGGVGRPRCHPNTSKSTPCRVPRLRACTQGF